MAFAPRPRFDWQLRSRSLPLGERTLLMAILNLTPDSFSGDGLAERGVAAAVDAACRALECGADILDVGAESTRPGATPVSANEEQDRLLPVLSALMRERPHATVSVDTYHAETAAAAAALGAEIINDVSGLRWDEHMADTVQQTGCGLVLMHTRGRPAEWAEMPPLGRGAVMQHLVSGLQDGLTDAATHGIAPEAILLDPGFAFGKFGAENFTVLSELRSLQQLGQPLLAGLSRKGFLGQAVRALQPEALRSAPPPVSRRDATLAANIASILAGAHVLRVHDVQATREAAAIADAVLAAGADPAGVAAVAG